MSDKVLIPVAGLGLLAIEPEALREALAAGAEFAPRPTASAAASTPEPLLDAEALAQALNVPATWVESAARTGKIPAIYCGRYPRFRRSAVEAALAREAGPQP